MMFVVALLAGTWPSPQAHLPPVVVPLPADARRVGRQLIGYTGGVVRCGGRSVAPTWREPVVANDAWIRSGSDAALTDRSFRFAIDASGRPLDIVETDTRTPRHGQDRTDVEAALAAWQFPSGAAHADCTVTFAAHAYSPDTAPRGLATRYAALPSLTGGGLNVWPSFQPTGTNCVDERPKRRVSVYPDFQKIAQQPGRLSTAFFSYDVDADGVPRNVEVLASDGNDELAEAGAEALETWRFIAAEAYRGCRYSFWRGGMPALPAPELPPRGDFPAAATCVGDTQWKYLPSLARNYPPAFRRRGIEGWAIVRFDVASWGETGNIEILASEPADAFGDAARTIVAQARQAVSDERRVGCVDRVRFDMPDDAANVQADPG